MSATIHDPQVLSDLGRTEKTEKKERKMKVFLNNINGFTCKQTSLMNIVKSTRPDVICLVETKVRQLKTYSIIGYSNIITKNVKKGKGVCYWQ